MYNRWRPLLAAQVAQPAQPAPGNNFPSYVEPKVVLVLATFLVIKITVCTYLIQYFVT
jgi:hypothetical protein